MQDVLELQIKTQIDSFLSRKASQFPELRLSRRRQRRDFTPRRYSVGDTKKYNLVREV